MRIRTEDLRLIDVMRQLEMLLLTKGIDPRNYCLGCNGEDAHDAIEQLLAEEFRPIRLADFKSRDGRVIDVGRMTVRRLRKVVSTPTVGN